MDTFIASLVVLIASPVLVLTSGYRLLKVNGDAAAYDAVSLILMAMGAAFVGLSKLSELAQPWTGALPIPEPTWALPALLSGGAMAVLRAAMAGDRPRTVNVRRKRTRAWVAAFVAAAVVWSGSALHDMPSPFDQRCIQIHEYRVPNVVYGGPLTWEIDATVVRQCDAETRYTVRERGANLVFPIWERSDRAGNAPVGPRKVFRIQANEPFTVQEPQHPHYLAPVPPGDYVFTAYRAQYRDGVRYDYPPVQIPFSVVRPKDG